MRKQYLVLYSYLRMKSHQGHYPQTGDAGDQHCRILQQACFVGIDLVRKIGSEPTSQIPVIIRPSGGTHDVMRG